MVRQPRLHLPGGFCPVMLRDNGGQDIFSPGSLQSDRAGERPPGVPGPGYVAVMETGRVPGRFATWFSTRRRRYAAFIGGGMDGRGPAGFSAGGKDAGIPGDDRFLEEVLGRRATEPPAPLGAIIAEVCAGNGVGAGEWMNPPENHHRLPAVRAAVGWAGGSRRARSGRWESAGEGITGRDRRAGEGKADGEQVELPHRQQSDHQQGDDGPADTHRAQPGRERVHSRTGRVS